ncbi:Uncharacterized protein FWK35_00013684 [Aphis craccivora]|uniref:THAP-type domain-containing protein n=1 Tax=Aphis craccivora TaxID=307492 RepID=A0A6G0Y708_APHCR|nr:Uncharacterized protein FWK35_00013684 [Aphis craccivora]
MQKLICLPVLQDAHASLKTNSLNLNGFHLIIFVSKKLSSKLHEADGDLMCINLIFAIVPITSFVVTSKSLETWGNVFQGLSVGQRICEKHFSSTDIVREKIAKDSTGNILIKIIIKMKIINILLSSNPCTNNLFSSVKELNRDTDDDILATPIVTAGMLLLKLKGFTVKQYTNKRLANSSSDYILSVHKNDIPTPTANVYATKLVKKLLANKKIDIFSQIVINEESMSPYFEKSISVDEDLVIECRDLNKMEFKILLRIYQRSTRNRYKTKTTCFDVHGRFRHINCSLAYNYEKTLKKIPKI